MPILLSENNSIIPKTGGTWVWRIFLELSIPIESFGLKHGFLALSPKYFERYIHQDLFLFTFVRNPLEWYRSYWAFKSKSSQRLFEDKAQWHPTWDLDTLCFEENNAREDFNGFIKNVIKFTPGYLTRIYDLYTRAEGFKKINFIGKTENLKEDLIEILKILEVDFEEELVLNRKFENISSIGIKEKALFSAKNLEKIIELEYRSFIENDYSLEINDYSSILI